MKLFSRVCSVILFLVLCLSAVAQTALLNGTVTDATGAVVSDAKVTALNTATNVVRSQQTGGVGTYAVPDLTPGLYDITVEKSGFRAVKYAGVKLTVDQAFTLNTSLQISQSNESITVEGAQVAVNTTDAQLSSVIEHTQISELPLILRDPYQLVLLSPGVTESDNDQGFSINGGRERNNNFLLDGADNNDTETPGGGTGLTAQNPDSTEEFRILTNNFAPEFGRNNGAIIDVITRSGTNQLHGNIFYFGRWDALGARDFFNHQIDPQTGLVAPKNPYIRNLYGASLGGPIVKDKTFFFINYQGDRFITNLTNATIVPTQAFKSGVFTYINPANGASQALNVATPGAGNNATGIGLDPVMQKIFALYPTPNAINPDGITGTLFYPSESREKDEDATLKIDQKLSKNNSLTARYIYNWFSDPNQGHLDFLPGDLGGIAAFTRTQGLSIGLTSNPTNSIVNELHIAANRTNQGFTCDGVSTFNSFGFVDPTGRGADYSLPVALFPNGGGFGCQQLGDTNAQGRKSGTYSYGDSLSKVVGQHTMKFGGEFRDVYSNNFTSFVSRATFNFSIFSQDNVAPLQGVNPNVDSQELEDLSSTLLGLVNSQSQTQFYTRNGQREVNDELDFRQREFAVYAQDQWKVLPNLSITYGLRWEYYGVPFEAHGNLSNLFGDANGSAPFTFTAVGPGTGHQLYQSYYRNFEPRIGFAWDPFRDGKTSVRGGVGVFSDRVYGNLISDARGNPPFQPSVFNVPINAGPVSAAQLQNQTAPAPLAPSPVVTQGSGIFPDIFANNIKPPSVVSWNFGIQRALTSKLTLETNYVGNHGTRILRVLDSNPPQPGLVNSLVAYCANPGNALGCNNSTLQFQNLYFGADQGANSVLPFDAVNNNAFFHTFEDQTSGHSWYNALQVQVSQRAFHGLQIQLSYTYSHALDDSSDPLLDTLNNGNYPINSYDLSREIGNSPFDTRHRAVINFVYQPNIGRGKALLSQGAVGRVFEGWQFSGIATFQTGIPYDIFGPLDTLHTGFADRATVINTSLLDTTPTTGKINSAGAVFTGFNPAAFNLEENPATVPWGVPANVVRNNWYGPGQNNWDMSLSKTTALTEHVNFQLRFEVYNVFNRVQFAKPDNLTADANFGYSTSQVGQNDGTTGARQIQIGAKLNF